MIYNSSQVYKIALKHYLIIFLQNLRNSDYIGIFKTSAPPDPISSSMQRYYTGDAWEKNEASSERRTGEQGRIKLY